MRHANWNPSKHRRLPNGQWARTGSGKIVMNKKPRSYASRRSHASQVGRNVNMHNVRVHGRSPMTRSAKNNRRRNLLIGAAVVGVAAAGTTAYWAHHTLSGGPPTMPHIKTVPHLHPHISSATKAYRANAKALHAAGYKRPNESVMSMPHSRPKNLPHHTPKRYKWAVPQ